jgi:hypothetical protein
VDTSDQPSAEKEAEGTAGKAPDGSWWIRLLGLPILGVGVVTFLLNPNCSGSTCPAYSLANPWILRGERGLGSVIGVLAFCVILWRVVIQGRFPHKLSSSGFEWLEAPEVAANLESSVEKIRQNVVSLEDESERLSFAVESHDTQIRGIAQSALDLTRELEARIEKLETRTPDPEGN